MPIIDGDDPSDSNDGRNQPNDPVSGNGYGIRFGDTKHIHVKNFHVRNWVYGAYMTENATKNTLTNIVLVGFGNQTVEDFNTGAIGLGVFLQGSKDNDITNCVVMNASTCAYRINGDDNELIGCEAYCDEGPRATDPNNPPPNRAAATDYYFDIAGSRNKVISCRAERKNDDATGLPLHHSGHGFVVQGDFTNLQESRENIVRNCHADRLQDSFMVRGHGSKDNEFEDCTSLGDPTDWGAGGRISVHTGPSGNTFRRMRLSRSSVGVVFSYDTTVDDFEDDASVDNRFSNCVFEVEQNVLTGELSGPVAILMYEGRIDHRIRDANGNVIGTVDLGLPDEKLVRDTQFLNCTFVNASPPNANKPSTFIQTTRKGTNNSISNCIIKAFDQYERNNSRWHPPNPTPPSLAASSFSHGFSFDHCCLDNVNETLFESAIGPIGSEIDDNIRENPDFIPPIDISNGNPNPDGLVLVAGPEFSQIYTQTTPAYRLSSASECIDAGSTSFAFVTQETFDIVGLVDIFDEPRWVGTVDIGADESDAP